MRTHRKTILLAAAATAVASLRCSNSRAGTYEWTGTGVNGNWSTAANWNFSISSPGAGDEADFTQGSTAIRGTSIVDSNLSVGTVLVYGSTEAGQYDFTGSNTTLTVTSDFEAGSGAACSPTISSGLTINAAELQLASACNLSINSGGSLSTPNLLANSTGTTPEIVIGNQGTLTLTSSSYFNNGTLELDSGGHLLMNSGASLVANGSTGQFNFKTSWAVPDGAGVQVNGGGDLVSSSSLDVGSGDTSTLSVDSTGSSVNVGAFNNAGFSSWGTVGGKATVTFSNLATGTYTSGLHIANTGGTATVNINSSAQLGVSNGLLVGGGATSAATLTLNTATLNIYGGATFESGSTLNFQSGTLGIASNVTFSTGSTLNWSGGTLADTGQTLAIDGGVASLTLGGIGINGNTLSVTGGGHFDSTNYVDIGTFTAGTLNVSGTGSHFTTTGRSSNFGYASGSAATVTISSNGVGTFSYGLHMAVNGGAATLNINSGGSLNIANGFQSTSTVSGSTANITLATGTITSTGTTQFYNGTTLTADGLSALIFGDNATFSTGSTVNLSGTYFSLPSGKTLTLDGGDVTDTRNGLLGSGETYIIQNGGHWDATEDDLTGGTLTVTGSGSRFTGSGTQASEWFGPGLDITFTNSGTTSIGGRVDLGTGTYTNQLNIGTSSTATFAAINAGNNTTVNSITGVSTITVAGTGAHLTVTGSAQFSNGAVVNQGAFGQISLLGNSTFSTGSTYNSTGFNSLATGTLSTVAFNGGAGTLSDAYSLPSGNTLSVTSGGKFTDAQNVDVANGQAAGTLLVDGTGSAFNANNNLFRSTWGENTGNVATVTFSNNAVGSITPGVLMSTNGGTTNFNVLSNAKVTMGDLSVGSATTSSRGFITITNGTLNVTGAATLNHGTDLEFNSGSLNVGGTLTMEDDAFAESAAPLMQLGGLSMTGTAKLNLEVGNMIVSNTPLATIKGYLATGYNTGSWNGNGIYSTTAHSSGGIGAIGYASAGSIGLTSFAGQHVNPTDTLVRYTDYGDANLDGTVNALDFNALATNYGKTPGSNVWSQGDFNFDGTVNSQDFALLAAEYGKVVPSSADVPDAAPTIDAASLAATPLGALVPEPSMIAALAAIGALQRRRRLV